MREIMVVKTHTTTACYAWFERQQEGLFSWGGGAMTLLPLGVGGGVSAAPAGVLIKGVCMRMWRERILATQVVRRGAKECNNGEDHTY